MTELIALSNLVWCIVNSVYSPIYLLPPASFLCNSSHFPLLHFLCINNWLNFTWYRSTIKGSLHSLRGKWTDKQLGKSNFQLLSKCVLLVCTLIAASVLWSEFILLESMILELREKTQENDRDLELIIYFIKSVSFRVWIYFFWGYAPSNSKCREIQKR